MGLVAALFMESCTRTEAQQRGALHSHILLWYAKRDLKTNYRALERIPRTVPGNDSKQRSKNSVVPPLPQKDYSEDNIYHHNQVGRIWCEMIRPHVQHATENPWGGFDIFSLRVAGLARAVQSRLYLHSCSLRYCLLNRSLCIILLGA